MKSKKSYIFKLKLSLFFFLALLLITLSFLKTLFLSIHQKNNQKILGKTSKLNFEALISATIGVPARFTIFGYTSPKAEVSLEAIGVKEQTKSNEKGYFAFTNIRIPKNKNIAPCLIARDNFGRTSIPVCLPKIENTYSQIGPILLPPTLSLNKSFFFTDDKIIISGQTIPETTVNLNFFKEKEIPTLLLALAKPAFAFSKKTVETISDKKGNFTFIVQVSQPQKMKIVSSALYQNFNSPQSIKLTAKIYPWWMIVILYFKALIATLKKYLWAIALILEIIFILFIIHKKILSPLKTEKK